ncbi:uncharacterized protein K441DRAFT_669984 [Cenococcum geophilum 1.58]|uniref:Uncharacterized protein n=1 Tax=Cenococcum geophilum 1.58 TaxID=794803 RepID=A0ACC8ENW8_9PEZI|nr:hypothetical protein K441DRAFT_669984 [Cenococcum geophilum 1.58]
MLYYEDTKLKRRKRGRQDRCKQICRVSRQGASFRRANRRSAEYGRIWQRYHSAVTSPPFLKESLPLGLVRNRVALGL